MSFHRHARVILALIVAPLATGGAVWTCLLAAHFLGLGRWARDPLEETARFAGAIATVATVYASLATAVVAAPMVCWFRRKGWSRARPFVLLGLLIGGLPFIAYGAAGLALKTWDLRASQADGTLTTGEATASIARETREVLVLIALGMVSGVSSALAFWSVGVRRNPHWPK